VRSTSWPDHPVPRYPYAHKCIYIMCVYYSYQYSLSTRENKKLGWERYGLEPMRNLRAATDWCERLVNRNNRLSAARHVLPGNLWRRIIREKKIVYIITILLSRCPTSSSSVSVRKNTLCGYALTIRRRSRIQNLDLYSAKSSGGGKNNRLRVRVFIIYSTSVYYYHTYVRDTCAI